MAKNVLSVEQSLVMNGEPKTVAIDAVHRHPDNYRVADLTRITESIRANKFYSRIVVQKSTGFILAGNHRHQALEAMGVLEIPIEEIDVDNETARRILLADNLTSDSAENDDAKLIELLREEIQNNEDLFGVGITPDELSDLMEGSEEKTPEKKPRKSRSSGSPPESFNVIVFCNNPEAQQELLEVLDAEGYDYEAKGRRSDD